MVPCFADEIMNRSHPQRNTDETAWANRGLQLAFLKRGVPDGVVPVRGTVPVLALHLDTKSFRIIGLRLPYAPPSLLLGSCLGTWLAGLGFPGHELGR